MRKTKRTKTSPSSRKKKLSPFFDYFNRALSFFRKIGKYNLAIIAILVISAILRIYNFPVRWGLGSDDARDALIGLEALKMHSLPLTGSFSSAGPFVIGPIFYWFIMLSYLILPFAINAPWIFTAVICVLSVYVFIEIGEMLGGRKFGIIMGLLALTSPQLVVSATILSNTTFVYLFSALIILFFLLLVKKGNKIYAFLAGIFLGLAISFHYSSLNLLIFIPAVFILPETGFKDKIKIFFIMLAGAIIPSIPLLYWDSQQNFANIRNIMDYFLLGQYRIYVPNSWKLFVFNYLPAFWSLSAGGYSVVSLTLFILSTIAFAICALKKKISASFIILGLIFFILLIVNRYYHAERSEGYMLYLIPFMLIMTSLVFYILLENKNRILNILGIILLSMILLLNFSSFAVTYSYKSQFEKINKVSSIFYTRFPNQKFAIYDYEFRKADTSIPLSLVLEFKNEISPDGIPIGVICDKCLPNVRYKKIAVITNTSYANLGQFNNTKLDKTEKIWTEVNEQALYDNLIGWLSRHNLKSTFSLKNYIMGKLGKI